MLSRFVALSALSVSLTPITISDDFYRLNNVSWLQPMCECACNLLPLLECPPTTTTHPLVS